MAPVTRSPSPRPNSPTSSACTPIEVEPKVVWKSPMSTSWAAVARPATASGRAARPSRESEERRPRPSGRNRSPASSGNATSATTGDGSRHTSAARSAKDTKRPAAPNSTGRSAAIAANAHPAATRSRASVYRSGAVIDGSASSMPVTAPPPERNAPHPSCRLGPKTPTSASAAPVAAATTAAPSTSDAVQPARNAAATQNTDAGTSITHTRSRSASVAHTNAATANRPAAGYESIEKKTAEAPSPASGSTRNRTRHTARTCCEPTPSARLA